MSISLDEAVELTRTGDVWVFRGRSVPDRAIQLTTNSPVNHVGMAVVLDDMPPLMWHAELGKGLPWGWGGGAHRGGSAPPLRARRGGGGPAGRVGWAPPPAGYRAAAAAPPSTSGPGATGSAPGSASSTPRSL